MLMLTNDFSSHQKVTITWIVYWLVIVGFLSVVLKNLGINYNDNYIFCFNYFIGFGLLGMKLFKSLSLVQARFKNSNYISLFCISSLIYFGITLAVEYFIPLSLTQIEKVNEIGLLFPLFNIPTFIAKFGDIMFQQFLIISLVLGLKSSGLSDIKVIKIFTIAFLALHLPLVFIFQFYGLLFIIPSAIAGITFSYLILKFRNGHLFSILVHQFFYVILGVALRFYL
jgi:hypothetical protein